MITRATPSSFIRIVVNVYSRIVADTECHIRAFLCKCKYGSKTSSRCRTIPNQQLRVCGTVDGGPFGRGGGSCPRGPRGRLAQGDVLGICSITIPFQIIRILVFPFRLIYRSKENPERMLGVWVPRRSVVWGEDAAGRAGGMGCVTQRGSCMA